MLLSSDINNWETASREVYVAALLQTAGLGHIQGCEQIFPFYFSLRLLCMSLSPSQGHFKQEDCV